MSVAQDRHKAENQKTLRMIESLEKSDDPYWAGLASDLRRGMIALDTLYTDEFEAAIKAEARAKFREKK